MVEITAQILYLSSLLLENLLSMRLFSEALYDLYVRPPEGEELLVVMERYRRLGFPEAIGSVDSTHVKWSMCSKDDRWLASGKEGYPTLSFEVVVSHSR